MDYVDRVRCNMESFIQSFCTKVNNQCTYLADETNLKVILQWKIPKKGETWLPCFMKTKS